MRHPTADSGAADAASHDATFGPRVRNALAWRWGSQFAAQLITWTSTLIVVRLLTPADYGLFAMSQVVIVALNFLNGCSFATSLIQAERVTEREIGQVFTLLLAMNALLATSQFLLAPVAADFYEQPLIADMLRIQALFFLTTPFIALPTALLSRRIEFRNQGLGNMAAAVTGAVSALWLAWYGFGVWALVYAPLIGFAARAIVLTIAAGGVAKPVFDFRGAGALIGFGGALTLCQLFWIVQSQSDILIAGRMFDPHDLGLYSEALFLTLIITGRFLPPINEVAFPAYSELHKAGKSLAPYFERTVRSFFLVTAPLYVGLAVTAPETVVTIFGPKWAEMVPKVAGLAIAMPVMALQIVCSPATNAMGRPRIYVMTSICGAALFVGCFLWGVRSGPMGLVHAWWVAAPALLAITLYMTLPRVGLPAFRLARALLPTLVACGVMALAVHGVRLALLGLPEWLSLLVMVPVGGVTYGLVLWLGWPAVVRESWAMLRSPKEVLSSEEMPHTGEPFPPRVR